MACRIERESVHADDQAGDVVVATGFVGCLDEAGTEAVEFFVGFFAGSFVGRARSVDRRGSGIQDGLDLFVGELAREPVGTEQEEIAGLDFDFDEVGSNADLGAEGAGDDVAQRRTGSFGARHAAHAHLLFDQRMILGAKLDAAIAQPVAAAVPDVENPDAPILFRQPGEQADQGGTHPAEANIALSAGVNGVIGCDYGLFGDGREGFRRMGLLGFTELADPFGDQPEELIDGQGAGDFTGGGSAHAVADDVHAMLDGVAEGILVGTAFAAPVCHSGSGISHDSGSHRSFSQSISLQRDCNMRLEMGFALRGDRYPSAWQGQIMQDSQGAAMACDGRSGGAGRS